MDNPKVDRPGRFAQECREVMPGHAGAVFAELWQQVVTLVAVWDIFSKLYASGEENVALLNKTSGFLFQYFSRSLARDLCLRIARLTDPAQSGRGQQRNNISLKRLVYELEIANEQPLLKSLRPKVDSLVERAEPIRETRHKTIAHTDLEVALKVAALPAGMPLVEIDSFLNELAEAMNIVEAHYHGSTTSYRPGLGVPEAAALLTCLRAGHRALEAERF